MRGNTRQAQIQAVMGLIGIFLFAIIGTALLPTIGDTINDAKTSAIDVDNESRAGIANETYNTINTSTTPITRVRAVRNQSGSVIANQATAPGWQLVSAATGNISINMSLPLSESLGTQSVFVDYEYAGDSNLSATDRVLLDLWPTFIIIGGLLVILAAVGLR